MSILSDQGLVARHCPTFYSWVGNLGWPILLKQLRTEFRKNRFFYSHFGCLAVLGALLLIVMVTNASNPSVTPTQVGQTVFNWFFLIQFAVVAIVFPAFSATAFTEERSRLSLDLLLITTLSPEEIVWGKFSASGIYCLLYVLATVPLLAISFLFGGVTTFDVLIAYAGLVGLTLLICMLSLCISSCFRNNIPSIITVYVIVFLHLLLAYLFVYEPIQSSWGNQNQTLIAASESFWGGTSSVAWLNWSIMAFDVMAVFMFLFLVSANRIRPSAEDHSSKLRFLAFLYITCRVIAGFYDSFGAELILGSRAPTAGGIDAGMRSSILSATAFLFLITLIFPTEEADVSTRCRKDFSSWTGNSYALRLFAPGAFWGFVYSSFLGLLVCGVLLGLFAVHLEGSASAETVGLVYQSLLTLPIYLAAFGALGFLLSVSAFTPLYSRLTVSFIFVITLLLPMIFRISDAEDQLYNFYYMSPLVLWESLDYLGAPPETGEVIYRLFGIHNIDLAKGLFGGLCCGLLLLGILLARGHKLPLLRFRLREAPRLLPREPDPEETGGEDPTPRDSAPRAREE